MHTVDQICEFLERFAPTSLAEDWDNVGLLVGDRGKKVERIMTCLTVTPASAAEAADERANLVVTHHPLPFQPLRQLTADQTAGRMLLQLIAAGTAVYSPHTAFDSAAEGINQWMAQGLGLIDVAPLIPNDEQPQSVGRGRYGRLARAVSLDDLARRVRDFLGVTGLHAVGPPDLTVRTVAVACGSAGEFLEPASQRRCDLLITGETNFHTCLQAEAAGVALLLPGHYASERFALERLAEVLAAEFRDLTVWASRRETNPLRWIE